MKRLLVAIAAGLPLAACGTGGGTGSAPMRPVVNVTDKVIDQSEASTSDVLELTDTKLVGRPVGVEDPPIISCTRSQ